MKKTTFIIRGQPAPLEGADLSNAKIDITTDICLDAITDDETVLPARHSPSYM